MRKSLPASSKSGASGAHLLADYPANGSALMTQLRESGTPEYPLCGQSTSAPGPSLLDLVGAPGNHSVPRASSVTAGTLASTGSLSSVVSMDRLLRYFLQQFIRRGAMTFTTASGAKFSCGDGAGEAVFARFLTTDAERSVLLNPELALGEVYMEGTFVIENGSIADALAILMDQPDILPRWARLQWWLRYLIRHVRQFNPRDRAKDNVSRHYDLDGRLYSLFLDADKQ